MTERPGDMPCRPSRPTRTTSHLSRVHQIRSPAMTSLVEFGGSDVLADVLDAARVRGRIYCRGEFSAPWAIRFTAIDISHFHVIESGACWLRIDNGGETTRLTANDLVVIPRGHTYEIVEIGRA